MAITAEMVKELRERTGAAMMDCKKALVESNGDINGAIEAMRASGQAKAVKKAGRVTAEGRVVIRTAGSMSVMVEGNCETDFVAKDENFVSFVQEAAEAALAAKVGTLEALSAVKLASGMTVEEMRAALVTKIGENIQIRRIVLMETQGHYVHGVKIGVLVTMQGGNADVARDVAMHIAASKPEVVRPEDVSADRVEAEKNFFIEQAMESGKPKDIAEKMVAGRVRKFLDEISLMGQPFVKEPSISVADYLKQTGATVTSFVRFEVGEGIEKKEENFAEEVMAQVKGSQ
jgi:elongation factor Ts